MSNVRESGSWFRQNVWNPFINNGVYAYQEWVDEGIAKVVPESKENIDISDRAAVVLTGFGLPLVLAGCDFDNNKDSYVPTETSSLGMCNCKVNSQYFDCLDATCGTSFMPVTAKDISSCLDEDISTSKPTQITIGLDYEAAADTCYESPKLSVLIKGGEVEEFSLPCSSFGTSSIAFCVPAGTPLSDISLELTSGDWCSSVLFTSITTAKDKDKETCNGLDDDCDGIVDDGFNVGQECTVGIGSCTNYGTYICGPDGQTTVCSASSLPPSDEICDGADNDCDGKTDEPAALCGCDPGYVGDNCEKASISMCGCKENPQYFTCLPEGTCNEPMEIDGNTLASCLNQPLAPGSWIIHYQYKGDGDTCAQTPPQLTFSAKTQYTTVDLLPCPGNDTGDLAVCIPQGTEPSDIMLSLSMGDWCSSVLVTGMEPSAEDVCKQPTQDNNTKWSNNGFTFTAYQSNQYCSPAFLGLVQDAWLAGADTMGVLYTRYQDDLTSTEIKVDNTKTPSLDSLSCAIETIHDYQMEVALYLYVDLLSGDWRANINPSNETAWFNSFESYLTEMAGFADEPGVDILSVGAELHSMTKTEHLGQWQDIVGAVRNKFKGTVLYFPNQDNFNSLDMGYWQLFDAVGLTFWAPLSNEAVPTTGELVKAWKPYVAMLTAKANEVGKGLFFGEVSYPSREYCASDPWNCGGAGTYSDECQNNAYQAFYQVWGKSDLVMGALFWQLGLGEKGYDPNMCDPTSIGCCPMKQSTETIIDWEM